MNRRPSRQVWRLQVRTPDGWSTIAHPTSDREGIDQCERVTSESGQVTRLMLGGREWYRTEEDERTHV